MLFTKYYFFTPQLTFYNKSTGSSLPSIWVDNDSPISTDSWTVWWYTVPFPSVKKILILKYFLFQTHYPCWCVSHHQVQWPCITYILYLLVSMNIFRATNSAPNVNISFIYCLLKYLLTRAVFTLKWKQYEICAYTYILYDHYLQTWEDLLPLLLIRSLQLDRFFNLTVKFLLVT